MKLRYKRNGEHWMPEKQTSSGVWEDFKEDSLKKHKILYDMAMAIGGVKNRNPFYGNTKNLYFDTEMQVMAFLGAAQAYFSKDTVDFEIFIDKD